MTSQDKKLGFEPLLSCLRDSSGFDLTGYEVATLERRIRRRMEDVKIASFDEDVDCLEVHPEELAFLLNTLLINGTWLFCDREAWAFLAAEMLPELIGGKPGEPIRVMSAGCASGEEAFTIATFLAEALSEGSSG